MVSAEIHALPALCAEIHAAVHLTLTSSEDFSNRLWSLDRLSAICTKICAAAHLHYHGTLRNIAQLAIFSLYACWQRDPTGICIFLLRYHDALQNIAQLCSAQNPMLQRTCALQFCYFFALSLNWIIFPASIHQNSQQVTIPLHNFIF